MNEWIVQFQVLLNVHLPKEDSECEKPASRYYLGIMKEVI